MRLAFVLGSALTLALAMVANAQQTTQVQPRTVQPSPYPTPLYQMNDVGKSLNLNQQQIDKLNQLSNQTQTRYRENYDKLNSINPADRYARTQELNRQYSGDWMKGARDIFNQDQFNRYQQLNYQYGGFHSLADPTVQKQLNLTPEQVKSLNDYATWSNQQLGTIYQQGATDRDKAMQMYRDYQKEYQTRFNRYLTPDQQRTWRTMTGEPYTFQPVFTPPARP